MTQDEDTAVGDTVTLVLPAEPASARCARSFVHDQWADLDTDTLGDVELIATELITNAVRHGKPEIELRLRRAPFALDVAVLDHGPGAPERRIPSHTSSSGRGLAIIDKLALRWGCEQLAGETGKIVWASLKRS